jgi:hypothetical protein
MPGKSEDDALVSNEFIYHLNDECMTIPQEETDDRNKAIKKLISAWKKNLGVRQKALLLLQKTPRVKIKRIRSFLIP